MIITDRLIIREFNKNDIEKIYQLSQEDALAKWLTDQAYKNIDEAENAVTFLISKYKNKDYPYVMAIIKKETDELIGHIGLSAIDEGLEVGYAIGVNNQKMGYASEAINSFIEWSKVNFALKEIFGVVDKENFASINTLKRIGFTEKMQKNGKVYYVI